MLQFQKTQCRTDVSSVLGVGLLKEMAALKAPPALTASGSPKEDEQVVALLQIRRRTQD